MSKHGTLSYQTTAQITSHVPKLHAAINSYTSRYRTAFSQKIDISSAPDLNIPDPERTAAQQDAVQHTNEYYDIVTRSYESGWGKQFHYAPFAPGDSISHALTFGVYRLAHVMGLRKDMKVLDLGCGVGGSTREIAKFVGCEVVGVNINQFQVNRATEITAQQGLGCLCTFVVGDFTRLVGEGGMFPPECFDAVVAVEALCHAPDWRQVYAQIWGVLKPGGVFGFTEEVMVDEEGGVEVPGDAGGRGATKRGVERVRFDEANVEHVAVRNRLEVGSGVSRMGTSTEARAALRAVGFELEVDEDFVRYFDRLYDTPAIVRDEKGGIASWSTVKIPTAGSEVGFRYAPAPQKPYPEIEIDVEVGGGRGFTIPPVYRPWWYPLMGNKLAVTLGANTEDRDTAGRMSHSNRSFWFGLTRILVWLRIWPEHMVAINQTMTLCVDSYLAAGRLGIFTPCWTFVSRKPLNAPNL